MLGCGYADIFDGTTVYIYIARMNFRAVFGYLHFNLPAIFSSSSSPYIYFRSVKDCCVIGKKCDIYNKYVIIPTAALQNCTDNCYRTANYVYVYPQPSGLKQ